VEDQVDQQLAANGNELSPKQRTFMSAYTRTGRIGAAAAAAKVHRKSHYLWLRESAAYRAAFEATSQIIAGLIEDAAVERAVHGVKRPVLYQGKIVIVNGEPLYQIEFSDPLLITLLKKFNPAYKERTELQHSRSIDLVQRIQEARRRVLAMQARDEASAS
jgi:hypothetical protein